MNPLERYRQIEQFNLSQRKGGPEPPRKKKYKPPSNQEAIVHSFSTDLPQKNISLKNQVVSNPSEENKIEITASRILSPKVEALNLIYQKLENINVFENLSAILTHLKQIELDDESYKENYLRIIDFALNWLSSSINIDSEDPIVYESMITLLAGLKRDKNNELVYDVIIKCLVNDFNKAKFCIDTFNLKNKIEDFATYCFYKNFFLGIKLLPLLNLKQDSLDNLKKICIFNTPSFLKSFVPFYQNHFLEGFHLTPYDYKVDLKSLPNLILRTNAIDTFKFNDWIKKHTISMQPIARFLGDKIRHISMNTFIENLSLSIDFINQALIDSSYCFIIDTFKSTEWLIELSLPNILPSSKPKEIFTLSDYLAYLRNYYENFDPNEKLINKIVILDDGIYSGEQISTHLTLIAEQINELKNSYRLITLPEIFIIPVYSTRFGLETIQRVAREMNLHSLSIFKNQHIQTYSEIIDGLDFHAVNQLLDPLRKHFQNIFWFFDTILPMPDFIFNQYLANIIRFRDSEDLSTKDQSDPLILFLKEIDNNVDLSLLKNPKNQLLYLLDQIYYYKENEENSLHMKGFSSRGNVYFDFKIPDEYSFPDILAAGTVIAENGELVSQEEFLQYNVPPYKTNFAGFRDLVERGDV